MRKGLIGLLAAAVAAMIAADASLFGIAVWKIALAAAGFALFVFGGRSGPKSSA